MAANSKAFEGQLWCQVLMHRRRQNLGSAGRGVALHTRITVVSVPFLDSWYVLRDAVLSGSA